MSSKFRPLLAFACEDVTKLNYPVLVSLKLDGCFSRDALVTTNLGLVPIGEIVDKRLKVKVLSYNEETKSLEFKRVVNYFNNGTKTGLSFKGSKVTENHKFYTKDGWVEYGKTDHVSVLDNSYAQSILTGMLLGDSCPSVEKRYDAYSIRLTWAVSEGDELFGDLKAGLFSRIGHVSKSERVSGFGSRMLVYTTTPLTQKGFEFWHLHDMDFNNLSGFCKRKKKLETKDLKHFDDISLALWYFDDGSLSYNNGNKETPRITFSIPRYSEDSWEAFKKLFKTKYAVDPHIARYGKDVKMSFTSADSVYLLYRMARVASGVLPRKFPEDLRFGITPEPINQMSLKHEGFAKERTQSPIGFTAYDIEVEDNHNYFCNGTLVHNCRAIVKDGTVYSRSMKPIPSKTVQELFGKTEYEGFDGELVYGDLFAPDAFNKSTSFCMSKHTPDSLNPDKIVFHVFDIVDDAPYVNRALKLSECAVGDGVKVLPQHLMSTPEEVKAFQASVVESGGEGVMIRSPEGHYKQGRSTLKEGILLKLKIFTDEEATVVGFEEKMHNTNQAKIDELGYMDRSTCKEGMVPSDTLGALVVESEKWGRFNIGTGFDDKLRKEIWENKEDWAGKLVKFKYFEVGALQKPRFPVFLGKRDKIDM